jgi:DNA modification methylase
MHFKKKEESTVKKADICRFVDIFNLAPYKNLNKAKKETISDKTISNIWKSKTKVDDIGKQHPAPFSYFDIEKLLDIFTKPGENVIDPFVGVASTLIACGIKNRKGIGIDLNEDYVKLSKTRLSQHIFDQDNFTLICGNSLFEIPKLTENFDYAVTSPPYYAILKNKGNGVRSDGSQFRQGVQHYGDNLDDIGNQQSFEDYLSQFSSIMSLVKNKLRKNSFCSIVISDFTVNKKEKNITAYIIKALEEIGLKYRGTIVLDQDQKSIYPFGYPYDFVINHTNQYVLNFQKVS